MGWSNPIRLCGGSEADVEGCHGVTCTNPSYHLRCYSRPGSKQTKQISTQIVILIQRPPQHLYYRSHSDSPLASVIFSLPLFINIALMRGWYSIAATDGFLVSIAVWALQPLTFYRSPILGCYIIRSLPISNQNWSQDNFCLQASWSGHTYCLSSWWDHTNMSDKFSQFPGLWWGFYIVYPVFTASRRKFTHWKDK